MPRTAPRLQASDEQCNLAQVAAVVAALDHVVPNKASVLDDVCALDLHFTTLCDVCVLDLHCTTVCVTWISIAPSCVAVGGEPNQSLLQPFSQSSLLLSYLDLSFEYSALYASGGRLGSIQPDTLTCTWHVACGMWQERSARFYPIGTPGVAWGTVSLRGTIG